MNKKELLSSSTIHPQSQSMKLELNTESLRDWKLQSDWYSPTRIHNNPVEYDFRVIESTLHSVNFHCFLIIKYGHLITVLFIKGDRFIPNRSLMDLDQACTLLTSRTNYPTKCNFSVSSLLSF